MAQKLLPRKGPFSSLAHSPELTTKFFWGSEIWLGWIKLNKKNISRHFCNYFSFNLSFYFWKFFGSDPGLEGNHRINHLEPGKAYILRFRNIFEFWNGTIFLHTLESNFSTLSAIVDASMHCATYSNIMKVQPTYDDT